MDPLIGAGLLDLGGGILKGIFSPSVSKQLRLQRENEQKLREWSAGKITASLRPKTPYYTSGNLPQLGDASMRAVMGNLASRLGPEMLAKWGINPAVPALAPKIPVTTGQRPPMQFPYQPPPTAPPPLPGPLPLPGQPQFPGQQMLLSRYGLA